MGQQLNNTELSAQQLEREISRMRDHCRRRNRLVAMLVILLVLSAGSVLAATLKFPLMLVGGDAMEPAFKSGQVLMTIRTQEFERGDVVAFHHGNQLLIRRVIGCAGEEIHIDEHGRVTVNGETLTDDYITEPVLNPSDLTYPVQVPEGCFFLMGDNRAISIDSRMSQIGCVSSDRIVGKVIFRLWPLEDFAYLG